VNKTLRFYSLFLIACTMLVCGITVLDSWMSNSDGISTRLMVNAHRRYR
jgi:hypothetical protein